MTHFDIPIEIKTEDSARNTTNVKSARVTQQAESDIRSVTPRRGRGRGDSSSRSAFAPHQAKMKQAEYSVEMGGEAMPTQRKRQEHPESPFQRENEFSKLKDQVQAAGTKNLG